MRIYVGDQECLNAFELEELAYGFQESTTETFRELFLGRPDETTEQCAARSAVAREVLTELLEQGDSDHLARENALYAAALSRVVQLRSNVGLRPTAARTRAAA